MKSLADTLISQPYLRLEGGRIIDSKIIASAVKAAERYELDEATVKLIVNLSNANPDVIRRYIDLAWPAAPLVWIEFPSHAMLEERRRIHGAPWDYVIRQPNARTGMAIDCRPGHMHINCIEHDETCKGIFPWPMGYKVYREPDRRQTLKNVGEVWGYLPDVKKLDVLRGYGWASLHPDVMEDITESERLVEHMYKELAGFVRLTITALALLACPATAIGPPVRPRGRFVAHGATHPYRDRRYVTLALPKTVREPVRHVERMLATHHKRLHEVRAHYRHLRHRPSTPGWEQIIIGNEMYWRKSIPRHLRGDPDLGVVEHPDGTHVRGPK